MREALQDWGALVQEAVDGSTALTLLGDQDNLFDLLITDVGLPGGLNGRQLADRARMLRPHLAVLFITGYAEQAVFNVQKAPTQSSGSQDTGAQGFDAQGSGAEMYILPKPFSHAILQDKLRSIMNERPMIGVGDIRPQSS